MENHRRPVRRAFIGQLVVFVKNGPGSGDAATERMAGLVLIECLCIMSMEDIHGEERLIEGGVSTFCELGDFPEWLEKRTRVFQDSPVLRSEIVFL